MQQALQTGTDHFVIVSNKKSSAHRRMSQNAEAPDRTAPTWKYPLN